MRAAASEAEVDAYVTSFADERNEQISAGSVLWGSV